MNNVTVRQESREQDKLNETQLVAYLLEHLPNFLGADNGTGEGGTLEIRQLTGGVSNLTYRLTMHDTSIILRRPPSGRKAKTAHDMSREYLVLKAIEEVYPKAPRALLLCEDESILGAPFFIMQAIEGLSIGRDLPVDLNETQQRDLCYNMIEQMVELHNIDITDPALAHLGKPEGYIKRQLDGWITRYNDARTPDVPDVDYLSEWLVEHLPETSVKHCLVHNDFKFDNFILDKNNPSEIKGILDWEMSTLGDPLLDIGCSLAYWIEKNDSIELKMIRRMPTHLPGMLSRREVFDQYCAKMGFKHQQLTPYYVFGLFRLAGIAQQIYYRYYHGQTDNPAFKDFGKLVGILVASAIREVRHYTQDKPGSRAMPLKAQDLFDLTGKVALITGASRGIGEAVARLFSANGATVIISSRTQASLDSLAADIRQAGGKVVAIACHIGEANAMQKMLQDIKSEFGKLDILVNNAATNPFFGELLETPEAAVAKTIDVNIKGYLTMSQLAGKMMRDSGGGVIINTASVNGISPAPLQGIYSMTKASVMSMTVALAKEVAKYNIRVNSVLPGLTDTQFASALTQNEHMLKMILPMIPLGRMAQPDEIAPAFLFLASDASRYVTGIHLPVDGGFLA